MVGFNVDSFKEALKSSSDKRTKGSLSLTIAVANVEEEKKERIVKNYDDMKRVLYAREAKEVADIPFSKLLELIDDVSVYGDVFSERRMACEYFRKLRERIKVVKARHRRRVL